eukprot:jgi/Chlat1/4741/Chrsp308S08923
MAKWSDAYHDTVQYLLCYAAAGSDWQTCALKRGDINIHDVTEISDMTTLNGRINVLLSAMVVYGIIQCQIKQVPKDFTPLGHKLERSHGTTIEYFDSFIEKRIRVQSGCTYSHLRQELQKLRRMFTAVRDCPYVVHATSAPAIKSGCYVVHLEPVGSALDGPVQGTRETVATAIKCILCGLQALHRERRGHGDLRWQNVALLTTRQYFFLFDMELSLNLDQPPPYTLRPSGWDGDTALVNGQYTAASDLFQLGRMLLEALSANSIADMMAHALAEQLIAKALSVEDAQLHDWLCLGTDIVL